MGCFSVSPAVPLFALFQLILLCSWMLPVGMGCECFGVLQESKISLLSCSLSVHSIAFTFSFLQ